jgi:hypothetical protein
MKIGTIDVKISNISIGVFAFFTFLLVIASMMNPEIRPLLIWMIPCLFLLLVIPVALNYMSRSQYKDLEPVYEKGAKTVKVRFINENMIGKIVRIEGVVERVHFQFLNRPQYSVADRTGAISVKMFTSPDKDVKVNDIVEVYGQVIRRYMVTGEPVINCVIIRKPVGQPTE